MNPQAPAEAEKSSDSVLSGYSDDADPRSGHVDPPVDFGLKKIGYDNITVFFLDFFP